ncbi:MAG TPA: hypothetical protein VM432_14335 [Bdellovibrionales bacterium]|nr:hypothetical protein [Bdellovibrionales bacterium]
MLGKNFTITEGDKSVIEILPTLDGGPFNRYAYGVRKNLGVQRVFFDTSDTKNFGSFNSQKMQIQLSAEEITLGRPHFTAAHEARHAYFNFLRSQRIDSPYHGSFKDKMYDPYSFDGAAKKRNYGSGFSFEEIDTHRKQSKLEPSELTARILAELKERYLRARSLFHEKSLGSDERLQVSKKHDSWMIVSKEQKQIIYIEEVSVKNEKQELIPIVSLTLEPQSPIPFEGQAHRPSFQIFLVGQEELRTTRNLISKLDGKDQISVTEIPEINSLISKAGLKLRSMDHEADPTGTIEGVQNFESIAEFNQKNEEVSAQFVINSSAPQFSIGADRYFPAWNYYKNTTISRWGERFDLTYEQIQRKVQEQPFVVLKPSGKIVLHTRGANSLFFELMTASNSVSLFRGQDELADASVQFLYSHFHGHNTTDIRKHFFASLKRSAAAVIQSSKGLGFIVIEGRKIVEMSEDSSLLSLSDEDLATAVIDHILSKEFWFFSTSREGAGAFVNRANRTLSEYRFNKKLFLQTVPAAYVGSIHAGMEEAGSINHWEIGFPMQEDRASIIALIMSLEPITTN